VYINFLRVNVKNSRLKCVPAGYLHPTRSADKQTNDFEGTYMSIQNTHR